MTSALPFAARAVAPPVMEARRWLEGCEFSAQRPLINVSQAAPVDPPPRGLREAIAEAALNDTQAHLYGAVLGLDALRHEIAERWQMLYGGEIAGEQVAVTSGCNQAFCAAISALCAAGDEVILPVPWYFNHKMWLDMAAVGTTALSTGDDLLPCPEAAERLITARSRAIVLVSPNNPGGVEYPPALIRAFYELCQRRGLALILDETYRDFRASSTAAHDLFHDPDWPRTLIQLYSFSKSFRLTGHRVGALLASRSRLREAEKYLDTTTICPNQLGQYGALWGLRHLAGWLAGERAEILARQGAISRHMPLLEAEGWRLLGVGAYFAYLRHPFALPSNTLAQKLVQEAAVLTLPGTMFTPKGDPGGAQQIRLAYANTDSEGIQTLFHRLSAFKAPL